MQALAAKNDYLIQEVDELREKVTKLEVEKRLSALKPEVQTTQSSLPTSSSDPALRAEILKLREENAAQLMTIRGLEASLSDKVKVLTSIQHTLNQSAKQINNVLHRSESPQNAATAASSKDTKSQGPIPKFPTATDLGVKAPTPLKFAEVLAAPKPKGTSSNRRVSPLGAQKATVLTHDAFRQKRMEEPKPFESQGQRNPEVPDRGAEHGYQKGNQGGRNHRGNPKIGRGPKGLGNTG